MSKTHFCDICDKSYQFRGDLLLHKRTFHEPAKYKCDTCERFFSTKSILISHKETHDNHLKNLECKECSKYFKNSRSLKNHLKMFHSGTERKLYECEKCDKNFHSLFSKIRHQQSIHEGIRFRCDICREEFKNNETLKKHTETGHGETKPVKCELCKKSAIGK